MLQATSMHILFKSCTLCIMCIYLNISISIMQYVIVQYSEIIDCAGIESYLDIWVWKCLHACTK